MNITTKLFTFILITLVLFALVPLSHAIDDMSDGDAPLITSSHDAIDGIILPKDDEKNAFLTVNRSENGDHPPYTQIEILEPAQPVPQAAQRSSFAGLGPRAPVEDGPVHNLNTGLEYATIQDAISDSNTTDYDVIKVEDGTYYENVVLNKSLTIQSENGSANCIVNGSNSDYDPVLRVSADDVGIIGFTIERDGTSNGIQQDYDFDNTTIRDNIIRKINYGISFHRSSGNGIINNTIEDAAYISIYIYESADTIISQNSLLSSAPGHYYHFYIFRGENLTISNNVLESGYYGLYLSSSDNNTISMNTESSAKYGFYLWESLNNTISSNEIGSNVYDGILLRSSSCYNDIHTNTLYNNSNGIWLYKPSNNHNKIHDNRIFDHIGDHGDITSQNRHAIRLYNASYNLIYNNTLHSNHKGITIWSVSNHNEVFDNNVTNNTLGIGIDGYTGNISCYNTVHDNVLSSNSGNSVEVGPGTYNEVCNNTFHEN